MKLKCISIFLGYKFVKGILKTYAFETATEIIKNVIGDVNIYWEKTVQINGRLEKCI